MICPNCKTNVKNNKKSFFCKCQNANTNITAINFYNLADPYTYRFVCAALHNNLRFLHFVEIEKINKIYYFHLATDKDFHNITHTKQISDRCTKQQLLDISYDMMYTCLENIIFI